MKSFFALLAVLVGFVAYRIHSYLPKDYNNYYKDVNPFLKPQTEDVVRLRLYMEAENFGLINNSVAEFRKYLARPEVVPPEWASVDVKFVDLAGHKIMITKPKEGNNKGTILFFHGGCFLMESPISHFMYIQRLTKDTGATILSPFYRLAPEHPLPAAFDDVIDVTRALFDAENFEGFDKKNVMIAGPSAGSSLALAVAAQFPGRFKAQLLISPFLQIADFTLPSYIHEEIYYSKSKLFNNFHNKKKLQF